VLGNLQEGLALFGLVLVVLALTLYQEGKTEHALAALRQLSPVQATVVRDDRIVGSTRYMNIEESQRRLEIGTTFLHDVQVLIEVIASSGVALFNKIASCVISRDNNCGEDCLLLDNKASNLFQFKNAIIPAPILKPISPAAVPEKAPAAPLLQVNEVTLPPPMSTESHSKALPPSQQKRQGFAHDSVSSK
jgi:hypothetical protein